MKKTTLYSTGILLVAFFIPFKLAVASNPDSLMIYFLQQTNTAFENADRLKIQSMKRLNQELDVLSNVLNEISIDDTENLILFVKTLKQKEQLLEKIKQVEQDYEIALSKVRYKKGIELIKMIYEKTLGLDHHFSSLQTYQNVAMLSNPNTFPEFQKVNELIEEKLNKKQSVKLPAIFDSNPFASLTYSLVASFFGTGDKKDREGDLEQVACILDFTIQMNTDLNIIYYETEFLKESNKTLKEECVYLFKEYTKIIGYEISLTDCRKDDDWETVFELVDNYMMELDMDSIPQTQYKKQIDLEFSIDRLLNFMDRYNAFISQGEKYYQKFRIILNNYPNELACAKQLPRQFSDLKQDVDVSISKFNEAYNITELRGSKLKALMYGKL